MCIPQNLFIQIQYPLHLPHDTRTSIVEYRDETSLFIVAIAVSIGVFGFEAMGELTDALVLDGADYASVVDYFE